MDRYLVDTNILLRHVEPIHPMHAEAVAAVTALLDAGHMVFVLPQNISEFWNVCTRPLDKNGLGMLPAQADVEVKRIEALLTIALDIPSIYVEWRNLVVQQAVSGVQVHDARIIAAMKAHGLTHLLTFNKRDFVRYAGITVLTPQDVLAV